jgi:hypothetical protein
MMPVVPEWEIALSDYRDEEVRAAKRRGLEARLAYIER